MNGSVSTQMGTSADEGSGHVARSDADIRVEGLAVDYGSVRAVHGIDFEAGSGEIVTLLGPSGCGKTSTLRAIAGLERHSEGRISIAGRVVSAPADKVYVQPEKRDVGMVFQSYALWPHMTVREAVEYPLKMRKIPRDDRRDRALKVLEKVGMESFAERRVPDLSGGQQQRVAIARALVYEPRTLLLDEPLSNLDSRLREQMRLELKTLQSELGLTTIYVTHDQAEALVLSHRIIVMNKGHIEQVSAPRDIYERPRSRFVSEFVGSTSLLPARVVEVIEGVDDELDRRIVAKLKDTDILVRGSTSVEDVSVGERILLTIRPERVEMLVPGDLQVDDERSPSSTIVEGRVELVAFVGDHHQYEVRVGSHLIRLKTDSRVFAGEGEMVRLRLSEADLVAVPRSGEPAWEDDGDAGGRHSDHP